MIDNSSKILWDEIIDHQRKIDSLKFKMGQLSVQEQINILKYAFSIDDEVNVWNHLLKIEPIDFRKSERNLTKGLFDTILEAAIYPGNYELHAQSLLKALVIDFPSNRELIYTEALKHLDKADKTWDYEIYQRVCDLFIDIESDYLEEFLKRCREHKSPDIRDIDNDWDD